MLLLGARKGHAARVPQRSNGKRASVCESTSLNWSGRDLHVRNEHALKHTKILMMVCGFMRVHVEAA